MQFKFNLEKILNLVRMRETMKQMEVAAVAQRVQYLKNRKSGIEENMRKTLEMTCAGERPEWFAFYTSKMELDVKEVRRVETLIIEENGLLEKKRDELKTILLKRKSLESLREKRRQDHRTLENRKIQKQLDEAYQLTK